MTTIGDVKLIFSSAGGIIFGMGMVYGMLKQKLRKIDCLERRQRNLRGEDNGGVPKFVRAEDCKSVSTEIKEELKNHTTAIQHLDRFARWWMHEQGKTPAEIRDILED